MADHRIILTEDGSHSLKVESLQEHYHSTYGALSESLHVFIYSGLQQVLKRNKSTLRVLELGMGTGLNVLLTVIEAVKSETLIEYTAVEPFPLDEDIWRRLNYAELLGDQQAGEWFEIIHSLDWDKESEVCPEFMLDKQEKKLEDIQPSGPGYDLIYFDAFGPEVQAEMWTNEVFEMMAEMTIKGGILVTYSAKGSVKRALQAAGFEVERIAGPRGKRHMIRAVKC